MGKWSQYDEDSHRLPEGVVRTGYDADTQKYTFYDKAAGRQYRSGTRQRYGTLEPVDASSTPADADDAYCESWEEVLDWDDSTSCTAKATADYTASPDDPREISFVKGEVPDIIDGRGYYWQAKKADGTIGTVASDPFVLPLKPSSQEAKLEEVAPPPDTAAAIEHAAETASEPVTEEAKPEAATEGKVERRRSSGFFEKFKAALKLPKSPKKAEKDLELDPCTAKALYSYTASPDDPHEVSFIEGEVFDIIDKRENWWRTKKADGTIGIVPSNHFVTL